MRIAVIGGGVIGLTTAYALVRNGHEVDLIEQRDNVALETSFANGGQLSYRYVAPLADSGVPFQALGWMLRSSSPLRFRPKFCPKQWRWCMAFLLACRQSVNKRNSAHLLRLALLSQRVLRKWREQDCLDGFAWRANGKLVVYRHRSSWRKASDAQSRDEYQVLSPNQCLETEPALRHLYAKLQGGIYAPGDEVADCHRFCKQLLDRLRLSSGFHLHTGRKVSTLQLDRSKAKALCMGIDELEFDHVVIAAGIGSVSLLDSLGIKVPVYPLKGYSLSLSLQGREGVPETNVTDYDNKVVYARLDDQLRVAAMVDIGGWDSGISTGRVADLRKIAQNSFPYAGDFQHADAWAGMRPATPEGTPVLGASSIDNLWLNIGHGSLGFTLACGSAEIVSSLIEGRSPTIKLDGLSRQ
ncbi:D-amino acid dehydrogenase [Marinobacter qingdaonensis]|uniref:D-amino acid dehydrogenase n=1 Tax=Marinobacter qingdaonensis TaxID=3108486 RepID=A0ABU5NTP9_9GAMM|nr:D-amino acid dehydrogenase [Marinobacter sp. ASW11-75]MEA1079139.1 D-amino acid dehydrogenase [Marinobacter sp. ASW11-75]